MRGKCDGRSGQALPLILISMAVIAGSAALTVDVGRVYVLHDQTTSATSAAALAAAQSLTRQLNLEIAANPTSPPSLSSISIASAEASADVVYQTNMKGALPNTGLGKDPQVTIEAVTSTLLQNYPRHSKAYRDLSPYQGMFVIRVAAEGSTHMSFGAAVGVPRANVRGRSSALVGLQAGVNKTALLPLAMPANGGDSSRSLPVSVNTWEQYIRPGQSYFLYRGSSGNSTPSLPPGAPSGTVAIKFHNLYGSGNDGGLKWSAVSGTYIEVGQNYMATTPGTSPWNTFSSLPVGKTVILPVGDSVTQGAGSIKMVGFITARVVASNGRTGTHAGFVLTVTDINGDVPLSQLQGVGNSSGTTFAYQLIANAPSS